MTGGVRIGLATLLEERGMTLVQLSRAVGVSTVNLSLLKNGHAKAIRFSTLMAICDAIECTAADLIAYTPPARDSSTSERASPSSGSTG